MQEKIFTFPDIFGSFSFRRRVSSAIVKSILIIFELNCLNFSRFKKSFSFSLLIILLFTRSSTAFQKHQTTFNSGLKKMWMNFPNITRLSTDEILSARDAFALWKRFTESSKFSRKIISQGNVFPKAILASFRWVKDEWTLLITGLIGFFVWSWTLASC